MCPIAYFSNCIKPSDALYNKKFIINLPSQLATSLRVDPVG